MSQSNSTRNGCKDVFRAFLVENARYEGELEIPRIKSEQTLPTKIIPFSKAISRKEYNAWVHFYEDDVCFERLWNQPNKYLSVLKKYSGVITPDFSVYRDMPLVMQQWNVYRSRALGHWLQENGLAVITNVRWSDVRTFELCCTGVPTNSSIAVGSHGCIKLLWERECFVQGLDYVVDRLKPKTIVVYGTAPEYIFSKYKEAGITILQFDSDYMIAHKKVVNT